jgi:hypothetical protein
MAQAFYDASPQSPLKIMGNLENTLIITGQLYPINANISNDKQSWLQHSCYKLVGHGNILEKERSGQDLTLP